MLLLLQNSRGCAKVSTFWKGCVVFLKSHLVTNHVYLFAECALRFCKNPEEIFLIIVWISSYVVAARVVRFIFFHQHKIIMVHYDSFHRSSSICFWIALCFDDTKFVCIWLIRVAMAWNNSSIVIVVKKIKSMPSCWIGITVFTMSKFLVLMVYWHRR